MEVTRTFDLINRFNEKYADKDDILCGKVNNQWVKYTAADYRNCADKFSNGLLSLGIKKNETIATISNNRPEWNFIDMGIAQIGAIHVPIYPTIGADDQQFILEHCEAKYLFVSNKLLLRKIKPVASNIKTLEKIFVIDEVEGESNWKEIQTAGEKYAKENPEILSEIKESITPEDVVTIIYTSGTTGSPKGVMIRHRNIVHNFIETSKIQPMTSEHRALSFLPLCHVYERMMNYGFQYKGISIYYAQNMGTIADDLRDIKPHGFNTVPRLLEKLYDKIIAKGKDLKGIKKTIFFKAVELGLKYEPNKKKGHWYCFKLKMARKLVFKKWQEALGGNIFIVVSGGSALQERLERIFWAADIPVLEGYGLTETSPVIAVNHYKENNYRFGTVGLVLPGVEVKIAEDGEILCRGENIMKGYYKDEEYTKQVIDEQGWFHTGDIGVMEDGKFLKITDRKKEIFKLSGGKYIAPQLLENKFKESILIEQIMVVGENEKFASALISPNFNYLHFWAGKYKVHYRDNEELIQNEKVIKRMQEEVSKINKTLGQVEHIKRFRIVHEEWSPQTGELSPTLKLKRKYLYQKYDHILKEIYHYSDNGINHE